MKYICIHNFTYKLYGQIYAKPDQQFIYKWSITPKIGDVFSSNVKDNNDGTYDLYYHTNDGIKHQCSILIGDFNDYFINLMEFRILRIKELLDI